MDATRSLTASALIFSIVLASSNCFAQSTAAAPRSAAATFPYPRQSIYLFETGTVGVDFTIGADGTVSDCKVTTTSRKPRLDEPACT